MLIIMTTEQKAKAYDDALERMKSWVRGEHPECFTEAQKAAEFIFPKLAESEDKFEKPNGGIVLEDCSEGDGFYKVNLAYLSKEQVEEIENIVKKWNSELESDDERIREQILDCFKTMKQQGCFPLKHKEQYDSWIEWLEKQEYNYTFEIKGGHWYKCVCDYMLNGSDLMFKNDRLYYCRSDWRLNGEIDERNVKDIGVKGYKSFFRPATNQEIEDWLEKQVEKPQGKSAVEAAKEEKINNINCINNADKDEAKFHKGDWVISNVNRNVYHILNIEGNEYKVETSFGIFWYDKKYFDNFCRLWNIKDAKDGDILSDKYSIILFRKIGNAEFDDVIDFHIGLSLVQDKIVKQNGIRHYGYIDDTEFKPATKEQRKMFLQRIHEDGYEII